VTGAELDEAYLTNAICDAHRDDPEFGYRFLFHEVRAAGFDVCERTVWRICRDNGWWSALGKKRGRKGKPGAPAHDDLVRRDFTADAPNLLWLGDITEHPTGDGKLYLCAIKDAFSNRIVGYSIDSRMKSRLAVAALDSAVARRGDVAGCILHSDRGSQFRSRKFVHALNRHRMVGSMGQVGAAGDNAAMESFFALLQEKRPQPASMAHPRGVANRDGDLDREDLPPAPPPSLPGPIDPHRIRVDHDHDRHSGGLTKTDVTHSCSSPVGHNLQTGTCRLDHGSAAVQAPLAAV
jgi:transposase InsO family protein